MSISLKHQNVELSHKDLTYLLKRHGSLHFGFHNSLTKCYGLLPKKDKATGALIWFESSFRYSYYAAELDKFGDNVSNSPKHVYFKGIEDLKTFISEFQYDSKTLNLYTHEREHMCM